MGQAELLPSLLDNGGVVTFMGGDIEPSEELEFK